MTLLTTINGVCDAVNLDRFDSVYGSDDPAANTMLEMAQEGGDEIARRADWKGLLATGTIAASGSSLPADFQRLVPGGGVRTSAGSFVRPVTNSGQWSVLTLNPSAQPYYFLSGTTVLTSPVSAGVSAVIDYLSKYWIVGDDTVRKAAFSADDDEMMFPEILLKKDIIWRWRRLKGLAYDDTLAEFEADLVQEINADRGAS